MLWITSTIQAREVKTAAVSELGLFSVLPVSFFIAFSLLMGSFFITIFFVKKNRLPLVLCQTFLLIFILNLTPSIVEITARFTSGYTNYRAVDYILQTGQIDSSSLWAHNWPAFSIFMSIFEQISVIPAQSILLYYPTFFNFMFLLPIFVFFRFLFHDFRMTWIAVWFVFIGNWIGQDYFSMQSFAFFMIALILIVLMKYMNANIRSKRSIVLFLFLFFYVCSSHALSSLALITVVLALYLSKRLDRPALLLSLVTFVAGWTIFDANTYLSRNLMSTLKEFLDPSVIFQRNVATRISGSAGHIIVSEVRLLFALSMLAFGLIGIILAWRSKKLGPVEQKLLIILIGFSLIVFGSAYGGELFMRIYMFSLLPLAYFASKAIIRHKRILCVGILFFVILAPSFTIIAHYGNETIDYVPPSELEGVHSLYQITNSGNVIGGLIRADFRDYNYHQTYSLTSFSDIYRENSSSLLWTIKPREIDVERYICISYQTNVYFSFYLGYPEFVNDLQGNLTLCQSYNLIYSNPSFVTYYSASVESLANQTTTKK
jgi:hypothetical protein